MKLDIIKPKIIRTGEFQEQRFGVGDLSVLLDILRSKMYSNSVKALCQEIMSNGRDAHREVGKQDIPIEVKIPNEIDPTFYVKDFGPGITPDRMANIFILYGMSTKRDDDTQTGGFGLGAKTPFAYTDTFTVTSITPEDEYVDNDGETRYNVMVRREYIAYIDETKIGSMSLVASRITDEPQGTKVALVSQRQDFYNFKTWVRHTALYWQTIEGEPLPIIKGCSDWDWNLPNKETEGENWFLENKSDKYSYTKDISAIIDGIQYPINVQHLNLDYNSPESKILNYSLRLMFGVGEINITANREEIDYSKKSTTDIIKARLKLILNELQEKLNAKIEDAISYWEAKCLWNQYSQEYNGVITSAVWKGIEIDSNSIMLRKHDCTAFLFSIRNDGYISRREVAVIEFLDNTKVCVEDTGLKYPSKCRVQTLFNNDPNLSRVYVVRYPENDADRITSEDDLNKEYNFNQIEKINISMIAKTSIKAINSKGRPRGEMTRVYLLMPSGYYKSKSWKETDLDIEEDSGIYIEIKSRQGIIGNNTLSIDEVRFLVKSLGIKEIYGIPSRFLKKVGPDWQKIEDVVIEKIAEIEKDPLISEYIDDEGSRYTFGDNFSYLKNVISEQKIKNHIEDKDSCFLKYLRESATFENVRQKITQLESIRKSIGIYTTSNPKKKSANTIQKMYDIVNKKYPLIAAANSWDGGQKTTQDFAEYINLIDAKYKNVIAEEKISPENEEKIV